MQAEGQGFDSLILHGIKELRKIYATLFLFSFEPFMEHTVYILFSPRLDKYYVGYASVGIEDRIQKHLTAHSGFTSRVKDWKLVYQEHFINKTNAMAREKEIKAWKSRARILSFIKTSQGN